MKNLGWMQTKVYILETFAAHMEECEYAQGLMSRALGRAFLSAKMHEQEDQKID